VPIIFTMPNADTKGRTIFRLLNGFIEHHKNSRIIKNFGTQGYFSLMSLASLMVGNSSSGIIEAASFELPVVNIGIRQRGRVKGANIIDVDTDRKSIQEGIQKALRPKFRSTLKGLTNPYGTGRASDAIVDILKNIPIDDGLIIKRFCDMGSVSRNG